VTGVERRLTTTPPGRQRETPARTVLARLALVGWAVAAVACTPLGLARGDLWAGTSSGAGPDCPAFEFDLAIEDGRVGGWANSEFPWGTALWTLRGRVADGRQVAMETVTDDPRVGPASALAWAGTYNPILWELTEVAAVPSCPAPRVVRLQRK
jgi:hypothetical protein